MHPSLDPTTYIYSTIPYPISDSKTTVTVLPHLPSGLEIDALIHEPEGWTLITPATSLESHSDFFIDYNDTADAAESMKARWAFQCRKIVLEVHSSLEAVGLTAAVCAVLTPLGVSCNVVAGFHHDAIFVREGDQERAMQALRGLTCGAGGEK